MENLSTNFHSFSGDESRPLGAFSQPLGQKCAMSIQDTHAAIVAARRAARCAARRAARCAASILVGDLISVCISTHIRYNLVGISFFLS